MARAPCGPFGARVNVLLLKMVSCVLGLLQPLSTGDAVSSLTWVSGFLGKAVQV